MGILALFSSFGREKTNPIQSQSQLAPRPLWGLKSDLKKQSQFTPAQVGAKSFMKGDYDNKPACGAEENKANQSQSKTDMRLTEPVRGEIATALRASQ